MDGEADPVSATVSGLLTGLVARADSLHGRL
jgi:hypothetical protein